MPDDVIAPAPAEAIPAPAPVATNEPVVAATPTPLSAEPRVAEPVPAAKEPEPAKPLSTREAIRAAAAKVNAEPASQATPLKDAPAAKVNAEPAAVVKEPAKAAEPAVTRGEDGKFKSAEAKPAADAPKAAEPTPAADAPKAVEPAKPSHTAEPAPKRFSADAKEEWAAAPEKVRAEVARMEKELTAGFEKHRAAAERDAGLNEFHEMAGKGGTTVKEALSKYVGMENQLRADPIKGFELICQNAGISFRDIATKYLGQTPDAAASAQDATVAELRAEIADLKKGVGSLHAERQAAQTNTTTEAVTKFAAENPRFEELSNDIAFFLKSGRTKDLAEAYKLAERLNPAPAPAPAPEPASTAAVTHPKPTLVPAPASAAAPGDKSITGTPSSGSDPVRKQPSSSIKEAIRRAAAAAG